MHGEDASKGVFSNDSDIFIFVLKCIHLTLAKFLSKFN